MDELEDWQQPRQFGRDADRGPRNDAGFREQSEGRFDRPYRGDSERQGFGSGRFGGDASRGGFSESNFDPRHAERFGDPNRQSDVGRHWRDHASRGSFGNPDGNSGGRYGGAGEAYGYPYSSSSGGVLRDDRQSGQFSGKGPKGYQRADERIREDLCDRLTADSRIDAEGITVNVSQGVVTLEGTVPSRSMKRAAEDLAEDISGVDEVTNTLRVQRQEGLDRSNEPDRSKGSQSGATGTSAKSSPARNGH